MQTKTNALTCFTLILTACAGTAVPLSSDARAHLESIPETAGQLVYEGQVVPNGETRPRFRYERRVTDNLGAQTSTHLTYTSDTGELVVAQQAVHSEDYSLARFDEVQAQTGVVSSVRILDDGHLEFSVTRGSETERTTEEPGDPVVVGPTLFGFVLAHWDVLLSGHEVPVRFAVTDKAQTYGFVLRLSSSTPETTTIEFSASGMFVRMAIDAMSIVFDTETRTPHRYIGRVPPRLEGLATFDAVVDYELAEATYR
ncbi:MAG: hypothetical protein ACI9KE_005691 [Polyangiales bacterium]|jgi:hypothetical protein